MKYEYFDKRAIKNKKTLIFDFYKKYYGEGYIKAIENSDLIFACIDEDKAIGACRIITDYNRYAHLVDLVVRKDHRNKGIGRKLVNLAVERLLKKWCVNYRVNL